METNNHKRNNQAKRKAMVLRVKKKGNFEQIIYQYQFPDASMYLAEARREVYAYLTKLRLLQTHLWRNGYLSKANDLIPKVRKLIANWTKCYYTWLEEQAHGKMRKVKGFISFAESRGLAISAQDLDTSALKSSLLSPDSETVKKLYDNYAAGNLYSKKSLCETVTNLQGGKTISGSPA